MTRKLTLYLALAGCLALMGCNLVPQADETFQQLSVGMTQDEVRETIGPPCGTRLVRFVGHDRDYVIWEYMLLAGEDSRPT